MGSQHTLALLLLAWHLVAPALATVSLNVSTGPCKEHSLDFILLKGDQLSANVEDDIRRDLSAIGITVNTRLLEKDDFNKAMVGGDFHLCFTESWGPPYDPHSYAASWFTEDEAHFPVLDGLEAPMTKAKLEQMVGDVLKVENEVTRQEKWSEILQEMHQQAISNPMWSRSMPAVINKRLQGYKAGLQQFDYPVHLMEVDSGSTTVTVAPGAQSGLFVDVGPMDPHSYRPNEFFISNWIYEGLVAYGHNGAILPALATSWTVAATTGGGERYRFTLRTGVTFHDGTAFNCAAVKMNFDHVLHPHLAKGYHGWYQLPVLTTSWACEGEVFVVTLSAPYYPFLQDLSLIRPLRILSPASFINGAATDRVTQNSCPIAKNNANGFLKPPEGETEQVKCVGIRSTHGTGPWKYSATAYIGGIEAQGISEVHFDKNLDWWNKARSGNVEKMIIKHYADSDAINAALTAGTLDIAVGNVLTPQQVQNFWNGGTHSTLYGPPLYNEIVVMNAARAPTNDIQVRKLVMHAIDKAKIVTNELYGQGRVADSLFPKDAPYCDIDLTPRWDYDLEKAQLINCQPQVTTGTTGTAAASDDGGIGVGVFIAVIAAVVVLAIVAAAALFVFGKRKGYEQMKSGGKQGQQQGSAEKVGQPAGNSA